MVKSIFKTRREQLKKKLNKKVGISGAFGLGVSTGRKIEQDLFVMGKKKLMEQKRLATNTEDKRSVQRVIDEKFPEKRDRNLMRKLK